MSTNSKLLYSNKLIHHDFVPTSFVLIKFFEAKLFSGIKLKPLSNRKSALKRTCNIFEFVPLMIASKIYAQFTWLLKTCRGPDVVHFLTHHLNSSILSRYHIPHLSSVNSQSIHITLKVFTVATVKSVCVLHLK